MGEKLRILVVSYLPWRDDVSVGNTLTNLFDGMQGEVEFASIYFKGGRPDNHVASRHFYISEKELAKSMLTRKPVGCAVECEAPGERRAGSAVYDKARQLRWESLLLAQDAIGLLGCWHSAALDEFIRDFRPQLVFGPLGRVPAANVMMRYIHERFEVPVIAYAWDDHYSLKKHSWSPFFWAKTLLERRYIRKCAQVSDFLYTITEEMRQEYRGYFGKECRLLSKAHDFSKTPDFRQEIGAPVRLVYMGNIGAGRWQVLARLAQALQRLNADGAKAVLNVYTMSPKSERMLRALNIEGTSRLMDPVPTEQVLATMGAADILVHVEPTTRRDLDFFRLSFSTKIVDYLYNARCILAVGGRTAAMAYLERNDAAVVVKDEEALEAELARLIGSPQIIWEYGRKAWECGKRNHQKSTLQRQLYADFLAAAERGGGCNWVTENENG